MRDGAEPTRGKMNTDIPGKTLSVADDRISE